jgi:acetyl esterase/lipase
MGLPDFWAAADQAVRDAAYNNSDAVADSAILSETRNIASAALRAMHPAALNIPYGSAKRMCWDLFPARDRLAPCLVFIHGGYWQRNSREMFASILEGVLAQGWSAALPGYSLAPEASLTRIAAELRSAMDWLRASGPDHGIAGPVVVSGWSAGGHLATLALEHPLARAGLAISGIYDLEPIRDTYLNAALRLTTAEIAGFSPITRPMTPKPLAIAYGTAELPELQRQSRQFHSARAAAGLEDALIPVPGADHFRILDALRQTDGPLLKTVLGLLA